MALKNLLLVSFLTALSVMAGVPLVKAQLGGLLGILGGFNVGGTVNCALNSTASPLQVFPNALVQLLCGGSVIATTTTNGAGVFSMVLDPLSYLLNALLSNCNLVVNTPLSRCNSSLPSTGSLTSQLQLVGRTLQGLLTFLNFSPVGFNFVGNL